MRLFLPLRQLRSLSLLTALELVREPICLLLMATCVLLQLLNPILAIHPFGEPGKLARDGALAFHFVFGLFIAAYGAGSALNGEMRNGTAAAVLAKPVSRPLFFFSKFLGIAFVLLMFSMTSACATLLNQLLALHLQEARALLWLPVIPLVALLAAAGLNYLTRRPFVSNAFGILMMAFIGATIIAASMHPHLEWRVLPANVLITAALLMLAGIAVTLSTRLQMVPTIVGCTLIFMAGLISDYIFGRHADHSVIAALLYRVTPNWQHFWVTDGLVAGGSIPWPYVADAITYAGAYLVGALVIGAALFQSTDVEG